MIFEPKDVFQRLEFDKVLELLEKECLTPMAVAMAQELSPSTDHTQIVLQLKETKEMKTILDKAERFPVNNFDDITSDFGRFEIPGYTLDADSFRGILKVLMTMREVFKFFQGPKKEIYPRLYEYLRDTWFDETLLKAIQRVFDDKGEIKSDASPELMRIRKDMQSKAREIDSRFRQLVNEYRNKGLLSDSPETFRNNRRVFSVPSEHKRKVRGITHDESDTGKTYFIEPEEIVGINNELFELELDEKREIFKILRDLSEQVRPSIPLLRQYQDVLVRYDFIHAKARLAQSMRAVMPDVKPEPYIGIRKAYHPLLLLKNKALGRKTVPFDLLLDGENRILMLSGPNAGGKSVCMKSVGLLQMMVQAGFLVPSHELSVFGIFQKLFTDIGDQQSLDDDLSTYSSRLQNARIFIEGATPETLVIIDEMGSGTDPKPGGAISEAILRELNNRGVFGVFTTHYGNLKAFAFRNHGIVNGNMHFDKDTMSPTYELKVGRPGSSYAFEIATKSGLPKTLIQYARNKTGQGETAVDDLLIGLQREKQELEEQLREVTARSEKLERLIKSYDSMSAELEMRKKKLRIEEKEFELRQKSNTGREVQKLIKELRDEKNIEKAQEVVANLRQETLQKVQQVDALNADLVELEQGSGEITRKFKAGDFVRMRAGGTTGTIEKVDGNKAIVALGLMKMTIALTDLVGVDAPKAPTWTAAPKTDYDMKQAISFDAKLDIRGMSREESMKVIEKFVDNGLLSNAHVLQILHGKGDGILKKVVKEKLREYGGAVAKSYHPEREFGGDGVTMIELG